MKKICNYLSVNRHKFLRAFILFFIIAFSMSCLYTFPSKAKTKKISLNKSKITLEVGDTFQLKLKPKTGKIIWYTSNKKVASVNKKGKVTAKKAGNAIIRAKVKKKSYKCKITVKRRKKLPSSEKVTTTQNSLNTTYTTTQLNTTTEKKQNIELSKSSVEIVFGKQEEITLINAPYKVAWLSSDTRIAYCDNGTIEARSVGTATITAKCGGISYYCTVSVVSGESEQIEINGIYTSKDKVASYIHQYGKLPSNFITKAEAQKLGWNGGGLLDYDKYKCIGGDDYSDFENKLEHKDGRKYYECDINTLGSLNRGSERLVFSNDGLIYYTSNHYESFERIY